MLRSLRRRWNCPDLTSKGSQVNSVPYSYFGKTWNMPAKPSKWTEWAGRAVANALVSCPLSSTGQNNQASFDFAVSQYDLSNINHLLALGRRRALQEAVVMTGRGLSHPIKGFYIQRKGKRHTTRSHAQTRTNHAGMGWQPPDSPFVGSQETDLAASPTVTVPDVMGLSRARPLPPWESEPFLLLTLIYPSCVLSPSPCLSAT